MASGNFTYFQPSSSGGSASNDFVTDAFSDISLPANNNTGFSSIAGKNPMSEFFANDDAPKFGVKTLWVKDLVLIEDHTKWISNKPTYQVIFTEEMPGVFAYCFGNVKLLNNPQGISANMREIDDGFGITGVVRQAAFILNPSTNGGTVDLFIDGTDTTTDLTYGSSASLAVNAGINSYLTAYNATKQDKEIHDYRITANNTYNLSVAGIQVYFENASDNIDCFPGSTYLDKEKITTSAISAQTVPTITGRNGGVSLVYKTAASAYAVSTLETQSVQSIGVGASGTNTIDVTTGQGASFPVGSGIVVGAGASYYVGTVFSVSTDTLTVGPTMTYGVSGILHKAWAAAPTLAISATQYISAFSFDPGQGQVPADYITGFGVSTVGDFYYSDTQKRYRIWGDSLRYTYIDGVGGIGFNGASLGYMQCEGRFSAVELELASAPGATAIFHGTFGINGIAGGYGINEAFTSQLKKTVFTEAGPGWNRFVFTPGASISDQFVISKINFYQNSYPQGVSTGHLAYFEHQVNEIQRPAINATLGTLGAYQRVFADEMYFVGDWTRGTTHTAAGGAYFIGVSNNSSLTQYYYGTKFGVIGVPGTSVAISLDGAAIGNSLNTMINVATLGFHTVVVNHQGGTTVINAFDFVRPYGEIVNVQNFLPVQGVDESPTVYEQTQTPKNPKAGDIWAQSQYQSAVWVYLFNKWNKIYITESSDDPFNEIFLSHHGYTGSDRTTSVGTAQMFNFASWITAATSSNATSKAAASEGSYKGMAYSIDGVPTSDTPQNLNEVFNKVAWSTKTARGGQNYMFSNLVDFSGLLWFCFGAVNNSGIGADNPAFAWNDAAWASKTDFLTNKEKGQAFQVGSLLSVVGGVNDSTVTIATHDTKTSADSSSTGTAAPAAGGGSGGANAASSVGMVVNFGSGGQSSTSYSWNGSAWSGALSSGYTCDNRGQGSGYAASRNVFIGTGGFNGTVSLANTQLFNLIAFIQVTNSALIKTASGGACF